VKRKRVVLIGLGGIGKALVEPLCRFLNFRKESWEVVLVDGDEYEEDNATRQNFGTRGMSWFLEELSQELDAEILSREEVQDLMLRAHRQVLGFGNKAEVTEQEMRGRFPNLLITAIPAYVAGPNDEIDQEMNDRVVSVAELIQDGDTALLAVDNHKTRLNVSRHCQTLNNCRLISGGNDLTHGNVQVYVRRKGRDLFQSLEEVHPEIQQAERAKAPHEMSCEELATAGGEQIVVTNFAAASHMLSAFYAELTRSNQAGEIYFTVSQMGTSCGPAAVAFERNPQ
jgi:molybdopterin/thiamine biosynthesis adenylyltransferase